jgi:tetratricopeptide (TPR) repeat protein
MALEEKVQRHEHGDHPGVVASMVGIAEALAGAGRFTAAREYIARAEEMNLRMSTDPSVYSISTERSLGRMAVADGDVDAAGRHFERAVALAEELLSRPDHRYTVWAKIDYGTFLAGTGRAAEGVDLLEWALEAQTRSLGESHPMVESTLRALAKAR